MAANQRKPLTQSELIVQYWTQLEDDSAGASELKRISDALHERFGASAMGPAAIARVLADEGVRLRHPEILDADALWREQGSCPILPQPFETIDDAFIAVGNIECLSLLPDHSKRLKTAVLTLRDELALIAKSPIASAQAREVAAELAEWLRIWLQNPAIFEDWLSLRQKSPEFVQKFSS